MVVSRGPNRQSRTLLPRHAPHEGADAVPHGQAGVSPVLRPEGTAQAQPNLHNDGDEQRGLCPEFSFPGFVTLCTEPM